MNINFLEDLNLIKINGISNLIPSFLIKIHKILDTLDIKEYSDIYDGLRRYLKLEVSVENDKLINHILGILFVVHLNSYKILKDQIILELRKLILNKGDNPDLMKIIHALEFFINNYYTILSIEDIELNSHRSKLILMERVSKFIIDPTLRDKSVDLILLMGRIL